MRRRCAAAAPVLTPLPAGRACGLLRAHMRYDKVMGQRESSGRGKTGALALLLALATPFALVGAAFLALTREQQGILRDWLLSVFVLLPLALCALPLYLLMLALGQAALPKSGGGAPGSGCGRCAGRAGPSSSGCAPGRGNCPASDTTAETAGKERGERANG